MFVKEDAYIQTYITKKNKSNQIYSVFFCFYHDTRSSNIFSSRCTNYFFREVSAINQQCLIAMLLVYLAGTLDSDSGVAVFVVFALAGGYIYV